jgi:Putative zinc-finger
MVRMDHSDAVRLQAAEKYVLGELSPTHRDEYEEHYFDCRECALDVRAVVAFADTAREVLRQDDQRAFSESKAAKRGGWFAWLRPAFAVPAMAVLLLVVGYQNFVTIPAARQEAAHGAAQLFASPFSLQMANVRGGEEVKIQIHSNESLPLKFDFTPGKIFDEYICQVQDEAGRALYQVKVPGALANKEINLVVPAGSVKTGKYALVFTGVPSASKQPARDEVLRLGFSVEILP